MRSGFRFTSLMVLFILGMSVVTNGLHAQTELGTRLGFKRAQMPDFKSDETRIRYLMQEFARCAIELNESRARALIASQPFTAESQKSARMLADDQCLTSGEIVFTEPLMRGAVFSNLYQKDFAKEGSLDFVDVSSPDYVATTGGEMSLQYAALRQVTDCAVRAAPASARNLIISVVASPEEKLAFREIADVMGPCISAGTKVQLTPTVLRGVIAEVIYHLTSAKLKKTE